MVCFRRCLGTVFFLGVVVAAVLDRVTMVMGGGGDTRTTVVLRLRVVVVVLRLVVVVLEGMGSSRIVLHNKIIRDVHHRK